MSDQFVSALEAGDIIEMKNFYDEENGESYTVRQLFHVLEDGANYTTVCHTHGKEVTLGVYNVNMDDATLQADVTALGTTAAFFRSLATGETSRRWEYK